MHKFEYKKEQKRPLTYMLLGGVTGSLISKVLAGAQVRRHLLLNDGVLRQLTQLLLRVRVSNRVVVRCRLVDLLYLPRVVFYVLEYLVRVLRF